MSPRNFDIEVPRNGHYYELWQITDVDQQPIDLTGHTLSMAARDAAGTGAIIATAILSIDDATAGSFHVKWTGSDFDAVQGATEVVRLAYDFKDTFVGVTKIVCRGHIVLFPEVTP